MPLRRLLAEPDDLLRIVQLENKSFADSSLTPVLFPNGQSRESQEAYVKSLLQQWQDNSACRHVKVIDTDLDDKIIAFARWYIFLDDDVKFIKTNPDERQNMPEANEAVANTFFGGLLRIRIAKLGRQPHCYLSTLCTDPQHQRRGAGTMLIQWGCEIAQKHNVVAYLEATAAGLPVYKKCGFQEVGQFVLDLEQYGGIGSRINVAMMKYPENNSESVADREIQNKEQLQL